MTTLKGLKLCGARTIGPLVKARYKPGVGAFYTGVRSCASVWACPACQATIRQRRAVEADAAMKRWVRSAGDGGHGGSLVFVTLTVPHRRDRLADTLGTVFDAWRTLVASRAGRKWRREWGVDGYIRAVEVTYGTWNGWHPHLHIALFVGPDCDGQAAGDELAERWCDLVPGAVSSAQRVEVARSVDAVSEYMLKSDPLGAGRDVLPIALELCRADLKKAGARKGLSPMQVAALAWLEFRRRPKGSKAGFTDSFHGRLWREYEETTKGRRPIEWSRGLRDLVGLDAEQSDEDLVNGQVDGEVVAVLTPYNYMMMVRVPGATGAFLAALEERHREDPYDEYGPLFGYGESG